MSTSTVIWAMQARGLPPPAKLVLILAADAADEEGCALNVGELQALANLADDGWREAVEALERTGLATTGTGVDAAGARVPALFLLIDSWVRA
jgi:hypothetical protein